MLPTVCSADCNKLNIYLCSLYQSGLYNNSAITTGSSNANTSVNEIKAMREVSNFVILIA